MDIKIDLLNEIIANKYKNKQSLLYDGVEIGIINYYDNTVDNKIIYSTCLFCRYDENEKTKIFDTYINGLKRWINCIIDIEDFILRIYIDTYTYINIDDIYVQDIINNPEKYKKIQFHFTNFMKFTNAINIIDAKKQIITHKSLFQTIIRFLPLSIDNNFRVFACIDIDGTNPFMADYEVDYYKYMYYLSEMSIDHDIDCIVYGGQYSI